MVAFAALAGFSDGRSQRMSKTTNSTAAGTKPSAPTECFPQPSGRSGGGTTSSPGHGNCTAAAPGVRPRSGILLPPASTSRALFFTRPLSRKGGANKHGPSTISDLSGRASVHLRPVKVPTITTGTVTSSHLRSASLALSISGTTVTMVTTVTKGGLGYRA